MARYHLGGEGGEESQLVPSSDAERLSYAPVSPPPRELLSHAPVQHSWWRKTANRMRAAQGALALALFAGVLTADIGFGEGDYKAEQPAQRCLAVLSLVAALWGTELIPVHITALLIPLLVVVTRVLCVPRHLRLETERDSLLVPASYCNSTSPAPGHPFLADQASIIATGAFFNPLILLFLSGFTMSSAFEQHGISRVAAGWLLRKAGTRPPVVLLVLMACCVLSSAALGNVAAAVLATALIRPTFNSPAARNSAWPKASLLAVAYSSNIGGMVSPVSSPQNLIALMAIETASHGHASVSFSQWLVLSVPFCGVMLALCWAFLLLWFRKELPHSLPAFASSPSGSVTSSATKPPASRFDICVIVGTAAATIVTWVFFAGVKDIFGNIGLVGIIPIAVYGGAGYLTKEDFNAMPWDVLVLIGGGLSLGTAVESSGLLITLGDGIMSQVSDAHPSVVLIAFSSFVALLANFISSTVAAVIILPLVASVGVQVGHPVGFVVLCTFMTSGAMGLPVSSFPNSNSMAVGAGILRNSDFVKTGFPMCFLVLVLVNTLGWGLANAYGW